MKEEFLKYFQSIGIKEPILKRIEELLANINALLPNVDFSDVGVSETVDKEGNRIYQILRLFSKDFSAAAHDFIQKTEIGFGPRTKEIWGLIIEARDFDFAHATDQSRIVVHVTYAENKSDRLLAFRGSGLNCDHILMLCRKYFFQQFVSPAAQVDA